MGTKPLRYKLHVCGRRARAVRSVRACVAARKGSTALPSLFRFLAMIAILGGLIYAGMFALATFVEPTQREMTVTIPNAKLQPSNK